jgi:hypothetical protein
MFLTTVNGISLLVSTLYTRVVGQLGVCGTGLIDQIWPDTGLVRRYAS